MVLKPFFPLFYLVEKMSMHDMSSLILAEAHIHVACVNKSHVASL